MSALPLKADMHGSAGKTRYKKSNLVRGQANPTSSERNSRVGRRALWDLQLVAIILLVLGPT